MSDENKPEIKKIVFMPGCFDDFEGTQEELDELIAHITQLAESGELEASAEEIPDDEVDDIVDNIKELIERKTSGNTNNTRH